MLQPPAPAGRVVEVGERATNSGSGTRSTTALEPDDRRGEAADCGLDPREPGVGAYASRAASASVTGRSATRRGLPRAQCRFAQLNEDQAACSGTAGAGLDGEAQASSAPATSPRSSRAYETRA